VLIIEFIYDISYVPDCLKTVSTILEVPVGEATSTYHLVSVTYYNDTDAFHCQSRAARGRGFRNYDDSGPYDYDTISNYPPEGRKDRRPVNAFYVLE
jgi:hypothetical protein